MPPCTRHIERILIRHACYLQTATTPGRYETRIIAAGGSLIAAASSATRDEATAALDNACERWLRARRWWPFIKTP